jgi:hypothetical protein
MAIESDKKETDPQDTIKKRIDWLFASYIQHDVSDELKDISEYFSFIADKINPRTFSIEVRSDLIQCFESVYLLLLDKICIYPDTIQNQIINITKENHICDIMAVAGSIDRKDLSRIKFSDTFQSVVGFFPFWGKKFSISLDNDKYIDISKKSLFNLKVSLNRLSSILTYAASIKLIDYDESFYKFKENYDPDLIDKSKLLAFINILRVQINNAPDSKEKDIILDKLENIETELRRSKARWGIIITGFFILFGFFADLKTIKPDIYREPYAIVQKIISTIHNDGIVSTKPPQLLEDKKPETSEADNITMPSVALPPKREDEIEDE